MIRDQQITLVVRTPGGTDAHGNPLYTTAETVSGGWSVQPESSTETLGGRDQVTTRLVAYGPTGVDVDALDAVRIGGDLYEVTGDTERWPSPTGRLDHTKLTLQKVAG